MKKKPLKKTTWLISAVIIGAILAGSVIGLAWSRTAPAEQEEEYTAYSYKQEAEVDYLVHMLPNEFFEEEVQEPGEAYLTRLTDYIEAELHYVFEGEREAEISGTYEATGRLAALTGDEEHYVVWEKEFEFLPTEEFSVDDKEVEIKETVEIPFAQYREFAEEVGEYTEYRPGKLNLNVDFELKVEAETDSGTIRERLDPNMVIPMAGNTYIVEGNLQDRNSDGIAKTREVPVPEVNRARTGFSYSTAVLGGILAAFLTLTVPVKQKEETPQEKKVYRLLKKHDERIAAMAGSPPKGLKQAIAVNTFEDILKVADELQKPVFYYQLREENSTEHLFIVLEDDRTYEYSIRA